ncbi:hypothetical protein [Francisella frigiditurris]|uniref:Uncharacterized protein n=1 Tax=Francisella frigiditurris TaxID=1542390 RepID=A0A1J0KSG5_9GAMM|nr:hypothetical protein [Francisella frigiditurris]APC96720.1 hypothetical protein KX01_750 [Francisella frigiditurris]
MKKPNFDFNKMDSEEIFTTKKYEFNIDQLNKEAKEIKDIFKLIQLVRLDRIKSQEEYTKHRRKLINDRMALEAQVIDTKKLYGKQITSLHEEYNSVKSNMEKELTELRKRLG